MHVLLCVTLLCASVAGVSGCGAGPIAAVILSSSGGSSNGGPIEGDVTNIRMLGPGDNSCPECTSLELPAAGVVVGPQIDFLYDFEIRGESDPDATVGVRAELYRDDPGGALLGTFDLGKQTEGTNKAGSITFLPGASFENGTCVRLVVVSEKGDSVSGPENECFPLVVAEPAARATLLGTCTNTSPRCAVFDLSYQILEQRVGNPTLRLVLVPVECPEATPEEDAACACAAAADMPPPTAEEVEIVPCDSCGPDVVCVRWDSTASARYGAASDRLAPVLLIGDPAGELRTEIVCPGDVVLEVDNTPPALGEPTLESIPSSVDAPGEELVGIVLVGFTVSDAGSEPVDVELTAEFDGRILSTEGTGDGRLTRVDELGGRTRGLETSPGGVEHVIAWNLGRDVDRLLRARRLTSPEPGQVDFRVFVLRCEEDSVTRIEPPLFIDGAINATLVHTVAGVSGELPPSVDQVPADEIIFGRPSAIALSEEGSSLYVADSTLNVVWRASPADAPLSLERVVGTGRARPRDEIPVRSTRATGVELDQPNDLLVRGRELYVLERSGILARVIDRPGPRRGEYTPLLSRAALSGPRAFALDGDADFLYLTDSFNNRIIRYALPPEGDDTRIVLDDPARAEVIFGQPVGLLAGGDPPADQDCGLLDGGSPEGVVFFAAGGRRFLIITFPLADRIDALELGAPGAPSAEIRARALTTVIRRGPNAGGGCPGTRICGPRDMTLDGNGLFFVSDDVRSDDGRGVVRRGRITLRTSGPVLDCGPLELIAGQDSAACRCALASSSNYEPDQEGVPAVSVPLANARSIVLLGDCILFADQNNFRVRRVCPDGLIETFLGNSVEGREEPEAFVTLEECVQGGAFRDLPESEPALESRQSAPVGLALLDERTLVFSERTNDRVRILDLAASRVATISPREPPGALLSPRGLDVFPPHRPRVNPESLFWADGGRRVFVADAGNFRVAVIESDGTVTTVAGTGVNRDAGGVVVGRPAVEATNDDLGSGSARATRVFLKSPRGVLLLEDGLLLVTDQLHRILLVDPDAGRIRRVIGAGIDDPANLEDITNSPPNPLAPASPPVGTCTAALAIQLDTPNEMVFDGDERFLFIADGEAFETRRILRATFDEGTGFADASFGDVCVVARNGPDELPADGSGPPDAFALRIPYGIDFDPTDSAVYFSTASGPRIFRVLLPPATLGPAGGVLEAVAGSVAGGSGGDGGPPRAAQFRRPDAIRLGPDGQLYVTDEFNHRVRRFFVPPVDGN